MAGRKKEKKSFFRLLSVVVREAAGWLQLYSFKCNIFKKIFFSVFIFTRFFHKVEIINWVFRKVINLVFTQRQSRLYLTFFSLSLSNERTGNRLRIIFLISLYFSLFLSLFYFSLSFSLFLFLSLSLSLFLFLSLSFSLSFLSLRMSFLERRKQLLSEEKGENF